MLNIINARNSHLGWTMILFLLLTLPCTAVVIGQDEAPPQESQKGTQAESNVTQPVTGEQEAEKDPEEKPATPKLDAFVKQVKEIEQKKKQINVMFANMPLGFPEEQLKVLDQINGIRDELATQEYRIHQLAIDAYMESPNIYPVVNEAVLRALNRSLTPMSRLEKFDPATAIRITSAMIENGVNSPAIYFAAFRAAYAVQDFERAQTMLEKIKSLNAEVQQSVVDQLTTTLENWKREQELRQQEASANDLPRVLVETSSGPFTIELFENEAPNTVANFISLVESGYYNNNPFHLVQPGVLSQSGCPEGNGQSDPGYRIPCELDGENVRHHFQGSVSMRTKGKDTGGAIFFITHQPNNFLDGKYTVFGRVIENFENVLQLNKVDATTRDAQPSTITRISVIRKRNHPYTPKTLPLPDETSPTPPPASNADGN